MLAVPPAPGMRPRPISGRAAVKSLRAETRAAKAGSSTPEPAHGPWTRASRRGPRAAIDRPMLVASRTMWAAAGSLKVPNSSRSPPLQKLGPSPRSTMSVSESSAAASARPSRSPSRRDRLSALRTWGRLSTSSRRSPWRITLTAGPGSGRDVPRRTARPPCLELRPGLQHGIGGGLGHQGPAQRRCAPGAGTGPAWWRRWGCARPRPRCRRPTPRPPRAPHRPAPGRPRPSGPPLPPGRGGRRGASTTAASALASVGRREHRRGRQDPRATRPQRASARAPPARRLRCGECGCADATGERGGLSVWAVAGSSRGSGRSDGEQSRSARHGRPAAPWP